MADPGGPRVTQLRGTSDQLLLAIQTVALLEQQKRGLPFGDDRFPGMARAVREAAQAVLDFSVAEESEAARIHETSAVDADATTTIATTQPAASLADILEEWRAVERRLTEAPAGSSEAIGPAGRVRAPARPILPTPWRTRSADRRHAISRDERARRPHERERLAV